MRLFLLCVLLAIPAYSQISNAPMLPGNGVVTAPGIAPRQVATGYWNDWEFGTRVYLLQPSLPGSTLVLRGVSNDECMQDAADNTKTHFTMNYQHKSLDGWQCEERWCLKETHPATSVRVWGSAIWQGVHHAVSVTEFTAGTAKCSP